MLVYDFYDVDDEEIEREMDEIEARHDQRQDFAQPIDEDANDSIFIICDAGCGEELTQPGICRDCWKYIING